ncbi:hypothetical protein [Hymenobacter psoromatis]|uniref:hypothetical protein n=1 Tax=Hymenobacter psoromatis TaxID=1484116 RepID=UPI001CBD0A8F|nr:hypothetical protein [Hymenobacter psoromatis]
MRSVILLVAAIISVAVAPAMAQVASAVVKTTEPVSPRANPVADRVEALTTSMTQALGLTPAQVEKVRAINEGAVRSVEHARARYQQDPAKLRDYMEAVGLSRLERLKDVLNPAQFIKYQQKREEKMGIPTAHAAQGTPPPGLPAGRGDE